MALNSDFYTLLLWDPYSEECPMLHYATDKQRSRKSYSLSEPSGV